MKQCTHMDPIRHVKPPVRACGHCIKLGDTWVHLRQCIICGQVGGCDSAKNKRATRHIHAVKHPIMKSIEPDESWGRCCVDEIELTFA